MAKLSRKITDLITAKVKRFLTLPAVYSVVLTSILVTGILLGVRYFGVLQTLELAVYDQMVRWQPDAAPDSRLLIVGITEEDIQNQQQVPLADEVVAELLETLQQYQPRVIGLDLFRDIPHPPGTQKLLQQLQADNLIAIYELGDGTEVLPPPGVPQKRLGFNDLLFDADNVLRRNLLYVQSASGANKAYSFSLRVSLKYLAQKFQIKPNALQIGQTRFTVLEANSGGYQMEPTEAVGWQTLLKYRRRIARHLSLTEALNGKFDPSWVRDKVVLIGTTAPSEKDIFLSPYSATQSGFSRISGVEAHAQMVSQILATVLDRQPPFWFWTEWQEWLWIWVWSFVGGVLAWRSHRSIGIGLFFVVAIGSLWGIGFGLFLHSGWVPIAAPTLGLIVTGSCVLADKFFDSLYHDSLTGLPNRNLFTRQLKRVKPTQPLAVIVLELNRFELISDSLGHSIGEQFLKAIAKRLYACVPHQAHLARVGENEFALWLTTPLEQTMYVANHLQREVARPCVVNGQEIYTTTSVGVAYSQPQSIIKVEDLLRNAHIAMYRAKALGRMRPEIFVTRMHTQALGRWQLETDLRQAVERQEFQVYYQPIVLLDTGQIAGFEALVRWLSPHRGFVLPGEFISVAEETGLIIPLGHRVLQEACRQMKCWQEQFSQASGLMISVNLSQRQFSQPDLREQVKQAIDEVGLDSRSVKLEITESMVMDDVESAIALLHQLKALNIKLSIDDFGTGYSSFTSLHRFPIDTLKVDKSFISRIEDGGKYAEIVRTIVTLGHNLGMEVIAEGIETNLQIKVLQALKCKYGQGYFFSKPLPAKAATALLAKKYRWFL